MEFNLTIRLKRNRGCKRLIFSFALTCMHFQADGPCGIEHTSEKNGGYIAAPPEGEPH